MNIFGWKSAGRGYLRPAKTRVQQDRLPGLRGYALGSLGEWPRHYEAQMKVICPTLLPSARCG
jgi:hypothetical protein